jgi:hypothetical protein
MATITQSLHVPVTGQLPVEPTVRVKPTTARSATVANVGWRYRRRCTITNTGDVPISNYLYAIDLGDTTPLTTTKAQADGDDVRVWHQGLEVQRALVNWDSAAPTTLVWIVIPYLGAGESGIWDVVYGNANAVSAGIPTFALYDGLTAVDITTAGASRSTNAKHVYKVDRVAANAGLGGWPLSSGTTQPDPDFSAPGAWQLVNTKASDDDRSQEAYSTYVDTNTYYQGRFEARRATQGALTVTRHSGNDGVALRNPVGIESITFDLIWQNDQLSDADVTPIGQVVLLTRNGDDEEWKVLWSSNALAAADTAIASSTKTPTAAVREIAFAVWPYEGDNIDPGARPDRFVNAAWDSTLEVNIDDSVVTQSLAAEEEIYELATELRVGGGGDTVGIPPYRSVTLGNADQEAGAGTPRFAVALNQNVVIDSAKRRTEVWNSGLTAKVEDAPIPAVTAVQGLKSLSGDTVEQASHDWLTLHPVENPLANPSAETDATGWTRGTVTANVTAGALTRVTSPVDSGTGAFSVTISANTAGAGAIVEEIADEYLPVGDLDAVWVGMAVRTADADLQPTPSVWWYDASQVFLSKSVQADWTQTPINTYHRRLFAAAVPDGAAYYRVGVTIKDKTGAQTGAVRWDTVEVNDTEIAVLDVSSGTLEIGVEFRDRNVIA